LPINLSVKEAVAAPVVAWELALHAIPSNFFKHAVEGNLLAVVVFAALIGIALTRSGDGGKPVQAFFDGLAQVMFQYTHLVMRLTPLGVFCAMAYNVSHMAAEHLVDGRMVSGWSFFR
jgi:Na+/H+-dicarboxylate symporter